MFSMYTRNAVQSVQNSTSSKVVTKLRDILPGVFLAAIISGAAYSLRGFPALALFSPMIIAVIIGIMFANIIKLPRDVSAGIAFCQRPVLRSAIVLLGSQLTFTQIQSVGRCGLIIVAVALLSTFIATLRVARLMSVERKLA